MSNKIFDDLVQYLKEHKSDFTEVEVVKENYVEGWLNSETGTCCPSQWDEGEATVMLDEESLWKAIEAFSNSFQEGGENAVRNPLNKGKLND